MKQTVKDLKNLQGKVVFVRVDFNVPLKNGEISDDNRIVAALPTINYLREQGARVVLFSHLGKVNHKDEEAKKANMAKNDMKFVAPRVSELLNTNVVYVPTTRGEELSNAIAALKDGEVLLMQNTRYEKGESKNDPDLSAYWASLADVFVMDAFGSAHRAHSSTYGVPEILNQTGRQTALGFLMQKEVEGLGRCVRAEEHPYVAILGGAKVSDKILVVEKLLEKADKVIIGGAITCTFLKAMGYEVGTSRYEADQLDFARKCLEIGKGKIVLPIDHVIADDFANPTEVLVTDGLSIKDNYERLDIGPKTCELYKEVLKDAKIVFWNGPMGVFENPLFANGTISICKTLTELENAFTVIGGGDSAAAAAEFGYKDKFSHVSTGGGASLELIEKDGSLPGIDVIADKEESNDDEDNLEKKTNNEENVEEETTEESVEIVSTDKRKKVIIGNWKMNLLNKDTALFVDQVKDEVANALNKNIVVGIAPSFLSLAMAVAKRSSLLICSQNVSQFPSGAYTGEVSIEMLKEIAIRYSIVGHSERRQYFNETNESCNAKMKALFNNEMFPIYCVGETLAEYEAKQTKDVVKQQIVEGLKGISGAKVKNMIIAYEPVWSIGTGKNADSEIAQDVCGYIRQLIKELYSEEVAQEVIIQYGGSVKPENIKEYLSKEDIDGALVGGASLKSESFITMIKNLY